MDAIEPGSDYLWRPKIVIEDFQDPFYGPKSWLNSFRIRMDEWSSGKITRSDRGPKARASSWLSWSICFCSASRFCSNSLARFSARTDIRKWNKNLLELDLEYPKNRLRQFDKPDQNPREGPVPYASSLQSPILVLKTKHSRYLISPSKIC